MFASCTDPGALDGLAWLACYLTTDKHLAFYGAFGTVLLLLAVTAPAALAFGFLGAVAARSPVTPLRLAGKTYSAMVRGIPDIVFFLFFAIALDQAIEWSVHQIRCPDWTDPIRSGLEFRVCPSAKVPPGAASPLMHQIYGFAIAACAFAIVFGAFVASVLGGAMRAVPAGQMETAEAFGMTPRQSFWRILVPQMWIYALPGLSNLWMLLIKATPLLFLLGVQDIVYWARELGGSKTQIYEYPHPDWRLWYFLALLTFYLGLTRLSEIAFGRLTRRLARGRDMEAGSMPGEAA